jgi:hypothetical protein
MNIKRYKTNKSSILDRIKELLNDSFFSSKSFIDVWEAENGKGVVWTVENNQDILAVIPGIEFGYKPFCRFQSMPDGCYGGIILNPNIEFNQNIIVNKLLKRILDYGYQKLYIHDFYDTIPPNDNYHAFVIQTRNIDLSKQSEVPLNKKLQSEIRKAKRENVIIEMFHREKHFDKFIALMKQTEKRHNREPKYSERFYEILADNAKDNDKIIWLWCEHEGHAVTSHINIIERNQCLNWQVFYDKKFSYLKANQLMLSHLIEEIKKRDIYLLNLGASPDDATGLINYKSKWGGEIKSYNCYYKKTWLGKLI